MNHMLELKIQGMSCQGCVTRVKKTLEGIQGVHVDTVEVGSAKVRLDPEITPAQVLEALDDAGYDAAASTA